MPPKLATRAAVLPALPPEASSAGPIWAIEKFGALGIDEVHRRLGDLVVNEELVVATRNDIHDGVADSQNIKFGHEMGGPGFW